MTNEDMQEQFEVECQAHDIQIRTVKTEMGNYADRGTAEMFYLFKRGFNWGVLIGKHNGQ